MKSFVTFLFEVFSLSASRKILAYFKHTNLRYFNHFAKTI